MPRYDAEEGGVAMAGDTADDAKLKEKEEKFQTPVQKKAGAIGARPKAQLKSRAQAEQAKPEAVSSNPSEWFCVCCWRRCSRESESPPQGRLSKDKCSERSGVGACLVSRTRTTAARWRRQASPPKCVIK